MLTNVRVLYFGVISLFLLITPLSTACYCLSVPGGATPTGPAGNYTVDYPASCGTYHYNGGCRSSGVSTCNDYNRLRLGFNSIADCQTCCICCCGDPDYYGPFTAAPVGACGVTTTVATTTTTHADASLNCVNYMMVIFLVLCTIYV
ncbi:unnamed protein product [Adineta steineri]|uniref:Uncharacterized protein n=1 Tax=Adineta steineri TaxID=433720 RepID=A0A819YQY1_9BILA|nr:unnamed protein product [Adineta steineri]CAF4164005.1 unnamed protein product [Adineta steineri]